MLYVVAESNKKSANKILKNLSCEVNVLSWSELLSLYNRRGKKKDYISDEIFSLQFDTCLNSIKGKPGLKQSIFIISEYDIKDIVSDNFNLLEINQW